jgi:hypothetical protein
MICAVVHVDLNCKINNKQFFKIKKKILILVHVGFEFRFKFSPHVMLWTASRNYNVLVW